MSYYYKTTEREDYDWDEDGDKIHYTVKSYEGPFRTEKDCVEHAIECRHKDFEVIELP